MRRAVGTFLFLLIAAVAAAAQSPGKIIDRYQKAAGGKAFKRVTSTEISGVVQTPDGANGRFIYRAAAPDRLRIDIESPLYKASECYNGKSAWRLDERGLRTLLGPEARRLRLQALLAATRLRDLGRHRVYAQAAGKATIDGRAANVIAFTKDGATIRLYFDAATHLPIKQEQETGAGVEEIFYADYRPVGGVLEPHSLRIRNATGEIAIAIDHVEHNRMADQAAFRYPQVEGARPLPDLDTLMKNIVANQEKIEELRERYTFREIETENKVDGKGKITESETRVYEVTPVAGAFVRRLISVNGKPLSESELEKEDRRVQKEIESLLKKQQKRERDEKAKTRDRETVEEDDTYEERGLTILNFLKLSEITSLRREMFRGHEVIAFDFEPRKGVKTRNRIESLITKLAGTMWVDEEAQQIVRIEARLTDSFKFAGGLVASVAPSTAVVLEQEKVGDEVWLPSYAEANISARVFLLAKFRRNVTTRYSDYKKYQIDSQYDLAKPEK